MRVFRFILILSIFSMGLLAPAAPVAVNPVACLYNLDLVSDVSPQSQKISDLIQKMTGEDGIIKADVATLFGRTKFSLKALFWKAFGRTPRSPFIENTIEVLYQDAGQFGHASLRIGNIKASFNVPGSTSFKVLSMQQMQNPEAKPGLIGVPIVVPFEKINSVLPEIRKFYESSKDFNVPPMDAYAPLVQLKKENGEWIFDSPSVGKLKADAPFVGEVFLDAPEPYILTPNGLTVPIVERNGKFYIQSYSCSTSVAYILSQFFGIHIEGYSAQVIKRQILEHKMGPIIRYSSGAL